MKRAMDVLLHKSFVWLWTKLSYPRLDIPVLEPPLKRPVNPFEQRTSDLAAAAQQSGKQVDPRFEDLPAVAVPKGITKALQDVTPAGGNGRRTRRRRFTKPRDVRASDYVTPQKYLDGTASIPTWYSFQSNYIPQEDQLHGMLHATEVDRRLTVPTRTHIRFLVSSTDVLHIWAVPSLHIKLAAIPGRVERWNTYILREGVFYGQCAEMCGALHSFMPIVIEAVSPETYAAHARKFYRD